MELPVETTMVLIKPDAVRRQLTGEIISRFERKGLTICAMKMLTMSGELADEHYAEHVGKYFYPPLKEFMTTAPLVAIVLKGFGAVSLVRKMMGATSPEDSLPGTIRGDYTLSKRENLVHGSDSVESAKRELALWFPELELDK